MAHEIEQIHEGEVPAELAGTYADIRHCLRVSFVPLLFRAIAAQPQALRILWQQLRPNVLTRAFEESSDALRERLARAATNHGTGLIEPVLLSSGLDVDDIDDVREQVAVFHYLDPKLLLSAAILERLLSGIPVGGLHVAPALRAKIPEGTPMDMAPVRPEQEQEEGIRRALLAEILRTTQFPAVAEDLLALGRWPGVLEAAWPELRPVFENGGIESNLESIRYDAELQAQRLPYTMELPEKELRKRRVDLARLAQTISQISASTPRQSLLAASLFVSMNGPHDGLASPFPVEWERRVEQAFEEESVLR